MRAMTGMSFFLCRPYAISIKKIVIKFYHMRNTKFGYVILIYSNVADLVETSKVDIEVKI